MNNVIKYSMLGLIIVAFALLSAQNISSTHKVNSVIVKSVKVEYETFGEGKPNTTVIGLEDDDVKTFYNISNWPEEIVDFDLGNRLMKIIPIPGHQSSSIAVYDTSTKILLTGDTFYPGRLYVKDWNAFKTSIERLVKFTDNYEISTILGNHIEMTQTSGVDYPIETIYQPNEHQLTLSVLELKELSGALTKLEDKPTREVHDSFIIYPVD